MRRLLAAFLLASLGSGIAATAFWLTSAEAPGRSGGALRDLSLLAIVIALSSGNFVIRWFRWHFLVRRFVRTLPTRTSLRLYFGTLAAFATPLYLGELIRTALAARQGPGPRARGMVFGIWATERAADVAVLGLFALLARGRWGTALLAAALGGAGLALLRARARGRAASELSGPRALAVLGASSLAAWCLPVVALWLVVGRLDATLPVARAAEIFSLGSLLGGLSLLPLGSGVAGTSMIVQLEGAGVTRAAAVTAILLFRAGTSWYALGLGLLALVYWRRELLALLRARPARDHFDALASEYEHEIPAHVRERVVGRKIAAMCEQLAAAGMGPGARGLEIGCGHGWYAAEMAARGYAVVACDRSRGQLAEARRFVAGEGVELALARADARALPFPDASFDFAYGVNVLHHLPGVGGPEIALRELVRVLRPGRAFFLHEINTENPLFAFYMGYVFPLLRNIDDGTERWIRPTALPTVPGARWDPDCTFLTFLPDFTPRVILDRCVGLERRLEQSRFGLWSAHYIARLVVDG